MSPSSRVDSKGWNDRKLRTLIKPQEAATLRAAGRATSQLPAFLNGRIVRVRSGMHLLAAELDKDGNFATPFNTAGMYRGHIGPDGKAVVEIYRD